MRNVTFLTMYNNTRMTESYGHYSEKIAAAKVTPHADKDIPLAFASSGSDSDTEVQEDVMSHDVHNSEVRRQ